MVYDMGLGTFIRAAVVVGTEVDVHFTILEILPGQGKWIAAAVAKEYSTKQIIPMHPGRTAMFCPDFCAVGVNG